jgi:hypothetical protein
MLHLQQAIKFRLRVKEWGEYWKQDPVKPFKSRRYNLGRLRRGLVVAVIGEGHVRTIPVGDDFVARRQFDDHGDSRPVLLVGRGSFIECCLPCRQRADNTLTEFTARVRQ